MFEAQEKNSKDDLGFGGIGHRAHCHYLLHVLYICHLLSRIFSRIFPGIFHVNVAQKGTNQALSRRICDFQGRKRDRDKSDEFGSPVGSWEFQA